MTAVMDILAPRRRHVFAHTRVSHGMIETLDTVPERRLLAAVILLALRDLGQAGTWQAQDAAAYFAGDNFADDCLALGYDPDRIRGRIAAFLERSTP